MLRKYHRFFQSLQMIRDASVVALSFLMAYLCRFSLPETLPYTAAASTRETILEACMLMFIWPAVGFGFHLYISRRSKSALAEILDVSKTTMVAFLILVTATYFIAEARYSRAVLVLWALLNTVNLSAARVVSKTLLRRARARGFNLRHIWIVGTANLAHRLLQTIDTQHDLGLRVSGLIALDKDKHLVDTTIGATPVWGTVSDLHVLLQQHGVDQVIIALPLDELGALTHIMAILSKETVDVRLIPDFYPFTTLCGSIEEFYGFALVNLQATPLLGWNLVIKRVFDVFVACLGLVCILPFFLTLMLLVRLSGPGGIFYYQERIGMDGKSFKMIKFRTMVVHAEQQGAQMATADDPRCTTIGALMRRYSLDELPQLLNVLRGDMSLVGPRPERPCFIQDFKNEIPRYALRHKIKAGMTGWAQIHGMRGNTSIAHRIELDLYYIEHWSLLLDIKILLRTLLGGFLSPNAY